MPPDERNAYAASLADGAARAGVELSAGQIGQLLDYLALLVRWNRVYNLTAVRGPADMLSQHLLDCLAVVGPLRRQTRDRPARLLDVGSGAGLPGIVLATAIPTLSVTCVDSVGKKASFIRQAAGELRLANVDARHGRIESLEAARFDVVISRAFASLGDFVSATERHVGAFPSCWAAMKGKWPGDEIAALPREVDVFHVEHLAVPAVAADRCLVWMRRSLR